MASDSSDLYLLIGAEHRFTPSTILIANVGAQIREVDGPDGNDSTNPYMELTLRTQVNEQFTVSAFLRYGAEANDTVVALPLQAEYDSRMTLRVGTQANYLVSEKLALFAGTDLISKLFRGRTRCSRWCSSGRSRRDAFQCLYWCHSETHRLS